MDWSKLDKYKKEIEKVVVAYMNGKTREFTPSQWFYFEERIRKMCKDVEIVNKQKQVI